MCSIAPSSLQTDQESHRPRGCQYSECPSTSLQMSNLQKDDELISQPACYIAHNCMNQNACFFFLVDSGAQPIFDQKPEEDSVLRLTVTFSNPFINDMNVFMMN